MREGVVVNVFLAWGAAGSRGARRRRAIRSSRRRRVSGLLFALSMVLAVAAFPAPGGCGGRGPAPSAASPAPRAPADSAVFAPGARDSFGEPQLYLSWHAPYGMPGASDAITFVAGDTSRVDTLYLSFEPGRDGPTFEGMWVRLYFHPQPGDTLGPYWRYNSGERNWGNLRIQSDPDGTFPCAQPWIRNGVGQPLYDFDPGGSRLDFAYVVLRDEDAVPLSSRTRYCFARVLFHQNEWQLTGSDQPVCIEWKEARFSIGIYMIVEVIKYICEYFREA